MPMAPAFAVMMTGETAWALGAALEPIVVELPIKRLCLDFRVLGTLIAVLGLLAFVFRYSGLFQWVKKRQFALICAPAVPLIVMVWTDPWHNLFFSRFSIATIGGHAIAVRSLGPGFWAVFAYCYILAAVSSVLLVRAALRSRGVHRAQAVVMLFGLLLPWTVDFLDIVKVLPYVPVDLVSPTFALTGLTFLPAVYRFHLLELPPVAWAAVVKRMDDPVAVIDLRGRIVEVNPAAERLIGRKSHEVVGVFASEAFGNLSELATRLNCVPAIEQSFVSDRTSLARARSFDSRISPLGEDHRPSGWVLVLRDITDIKRAEEERIVFLHRAEEERVLMLREQAARAEAEAAGQAKDRFLATLSHELRTPLTPILATVSAMLDDPLTPEALRSVLEMIRRNVTLEARLIDDLLDLTRIRGGKLHLEREVIDAHQTVHHVIEICRKDLRSARLKLVLELAAQEHYVDADPARLQQVIWNLLKNAIKFTPAGGTVTVRSRDANVSPQETTSSSLILDVIDTGIGIDPAVLPRIFDLFDKGSHSPRRQSTGLGLGLLISRSIVEQHDGRLRAASIGKGRGAVFTVELPTVCAPTVNVEADLIRSEIKVGSRSPLTILLVEDNADTLNYLNKLLVLRGYHVHTATTLDSARRVAREVDFDVLISDIELPDGTGLELMWTLRGSRAVAGIALSGFGSSEDVRQSLAAGFAEHLIKPVDFRRLEQAIRKVSSGSPLESTLKS